MTDRPLPHAFRQALQVWMKFLVVGSSRPGLSLTWWAGDR